jgi:uncharacterized membrane protein
MVSFRQDESGDSVFTILPNCSLGWTWMKRLFLFLGACMLAVAAGFMAQGAWLVLPFAGLELVVLAVGVYLNARWASGRELVVLGQRDLRVLRGRRALREAARLPRYWTRVTLLRDPRGWYPSRLLLECHGRRVEVGQVLVESERDDLADDLRARLRFHSSMPLVESAPVPVGIGAAKQEI